MRDHARTRIEVRIGELVIGGLGTSSPDALAAAVITELQAALAREFARPGRFAELAASLAPSADRVRATVSLPPPASAGPAPDAAGAGRAVGAALARVVTGHRDQAGRRSPARQQGTAR